MLGVVGWGEDVDLLVVYDESGVVWLVVVMVGD